VVDNEKDPTKYVPNDRGYYGDELYLLEYFFTPQELEARARTFVSKIPPEGQIRRLPQRESTIYTNEIEAGLRPAAIYDANGEALPGKLAELGRTAMAAPVDPDKLPLNQKYGDPTSIGIGVASGVSSEAYLAGVFAQIEYAKYLESLPLKQFLDLYNAELVQGQPAFGAKEAPVAEAVANKLIAQGQARYEQFGTSGLYELVSTGPAVGAAIAIAQGLLDQLPLNQPLAPPSGFVEVPDGRGPIGGAAAGIIGGIIGGPDVPGGQINGPPKAKFDQGKDPQGNLIPGIGDIDQLVQLNPPDP
jgi:hypothetical protein